MTTGRRTGRIEPSVARIVVAGAVALVVLAGTLGSTIAERTELAAVGSSGARPPANDTSATQVGDSTTAGATISHYGPYSGIS